MVFQIILLIGVAGLAFFFREDLALFLRGLKAGAQTTQDVGGVVSTVTTGIEQAGKNLASNLTLTVQPDTPIFGSETGILGSKSVEQFLKDAQTNLDSNIAGVNATLVDAQKNLEQFANDAQKNIVESGNQIFEDITNFFSSFGGQTETKPIATSVESTPKIMTQDGQTFDLSFLTPVEELEDSGGFVGANVVTTNEPIESTRFSGSGSLR